MSLDEKYAKLKDYWNRFGKTFETMTPATLGTALQIWIHLMNDVNIDTILEVGCGTGTITKHLLHSLLRPQQSKIYCIDLSEEMVNFTSETLEDKAIVTVGNAEILDNFESASIDRYLANYVLHLTPEPLNMLNECYRILKPGGRAGFSVWGRPEYSPRFTIVDNVFDSFIRSEKVERSNFHLCDKDKTIELIKSVGFSKVYGWYTMTTTPVGIDEYVDSIRNSPTMQKILDTELKERISEKIREEYIKEFIDKSSPIFHETLIVIAEK